MGEEEEKIIEIYKVMKFLNYDLIFFDLMREIFLRLFVKFLVRFCCILKLWLFFIIELYFIKLFIIRFLFRFRFFISFKKWVIMLFILLL